MYEVGPVIGCDDFNPFGKARFTSFLILSFTLSITLSTFSRTGQRRFLLRLHLCRQVQHTLSYLRAELNMRNVPQ